jgi:3-deoxy-D-manno-octulosonic-acid transferase
VKEIAQRNEAVEVAARFKGNERVFVIGSAWQEDIDVLLPFINEGKLKFIIAPHEIHRTQIEALQRSLTVKSVLYSEASHRELDEYSVLIIDNVGLLSKLYRYGEFAYVGGAYGKGLHNILEAACYGIPILFGDKNYEKFREAVELINRGGAFQLACEVCRQYVEENTGATNAIMDYCRNILKQE